MDPVGAAVTGVSANPGNITGRAAGPGRRGRGTGQRSGAAGQRDRRARTGAVRHRFADVDAAPRRVSETGSHSRVGFATPDRRGAGLLRAGRGPATWWGAQLAYFLVVAVYIGSLGWMWERGSQSVRGGTLAMSGAIFLASVARLVLPESRVGMIASRKRFTDVITLAALAVGLLAAGLALPAS
jgi:Protein of unknown function (DUF3017)